MLYIVSIDMKSHIVYTFQATSKLISKHSHIRDTYDATEETTNTNVEGGSDTFASSILHCQ